LGQIIEKADACVACGLCLNHCPTYQLEQTEVESPRGRIALAKGIVSNNIELNKKNIKHLDNCLVCGTCEKVCPANVRYTELIDDVRTVIFERGYISRIDKFFNWLVSKKNRLSIVAKLLWIYNKTGIKNLTSFLPISNLPDVERCSGWDAHYPAKGTRVGKVYLFVGCVANLFDRDTLKATIKILNDQGYDIAIPDKQSCCGAVSAHCGDKRRFDYFKGVNLEAFKETDIPVIVTSSGCAAVLKDTMVSNVYDICDFISQKVKNKSKTEFVLRNVKSEEKIGVYVPCTLRNKLRTEKSIFELLKAYGVVNYIDLSSQTNCCGAAGTYMFRHKKKANQLKERLYNKIAEENITTVLTLNIGCRLHLMNQKGRQRFNVMHPVKYICDICSD